MTGFLKSLKNRLTGSGSASRAAAHDVGVAAMGRAAALGYPVPAPMRYYLSKNRFHLDTRNPASIIVVHDVLGSASALSPFSAAITTMPTSGTCPQLPLDTYMPDLRLHGRTAESVAENSLASASSSEVAPFGVAACVSDILRFHAHVVEFTENVHVIGFGYLGSRVALAAALTAPEAFASVTTIDGSASIDATKAIIKVLRTLPPASETNLVTMSEALAKVMPNERERLALLTNYTEPSVANEFKASWKFDLDRIEASLDGLVLPPALLNAQSGCFRGPCVVLGQKWPAALPAELTSSGQAAKLFSQQQTASVPSEGGSAALVEACLQRIDLAGRVEDVVATATAV